MKKMSCSEGAQILDQLRSEGWRVAVHNDYRENGGDHTFWLFTHPSGWWAKGEGRGDEEALLVAFAQARERAIASDGSTADLLTACKAQHEAIDWLMASLAKADKTFLPSKSQAWPAMLAGNAAIAKAEARS